MIDVICIGRAIYLGETFCSYISINNSSNFEARDIVIKVIALTLYFRYICAGKVTRGKREKRKENN